MATATNDKPVRLGDLPVVKTNILENARQYDKGIIGGYNGTFPLTAATKGNIYLLPTTNKFYMCITNYNGSNLTAPNANFEELSVWANRDKLENLGSDVWYSKALPGKGRIYFLVSTNYIYISFPPGEYSKNVPLATFEELKIKNITNSYWTTVDIEIGDDLLEIRLDRSTKQITISKDMVLTKKIICYVPLLRKPFVLNVE